MTDKRRGSGPGPRRPDPERTAPMTKPAGDRPVDVFFPGPAVTAPIARPAERHGALVEDRDDDLDERAFVDGARGTAGPADAAAGVPAEPPRATAPSDGLVPVPGLRFAELPVGPIRPNPRQPRQVFDEDALAELVHSVREIGVLQPVVVRPAGRRGGSRRTSWSWASAAGGPSRRPASRPSRRSSGTPRDDELLRDALLENLHRAELNPLEEAAAYQQLLRGLRLHPRGAGRPHRPEPAADQQHPAAAQAAARRSSAGSRPACSRPVTPGRCSASRTPTAWSGSPSRIVAEGLSVRAVEEIVALGDGPAEAAGASGPRPAATRAS